MREYELVGGPKDGVRVATNGASVLVIPVMTPVTAAAFSWVDLDTRPSFDEIRYYRTGNVYRWEGLIEDAWCDLDVSYEVLAEGGPLIRREIRRMVRRELDGMAAGKEVGRIVWRIVNVAGRNHVRTFRAIVGPRRVERGLRERQDRIAGFARFWDR